MPHLNHNENVQLNHSVISTRICGFNKMVLKIIHHELLSSIIQCSILAVMGTSSETGSDSRTGEELTVRFLRVLNGDAELFKSPPEYAQVEEPAEERIGMKSEEKELVGYAAAGIVRTSTLAASIV